MPNEPTMVLRRATAQDAAAIAELYAHFVRTHPATFELDPPDAAEVGSRIGKVLGGGYPYWVAEADGKLLGFAYASTYRDRPAYRTTVENSVYVAHDAGRRGVGTALMQHVIDDCRRLGYREMLAVIGDSANVPSIRLHARLGFVHVGVFRNVGFKFGRRLDTVLMQLTL
jgi:phosphinothricin acetyltransferase